MRQKGVEITWQGKRYTLAVQRELQKAIRKSALIVHRQTVANLEVEGPKFKTEDAAPNGAYYYRGLDKWVVPSNPGTPPHKQTGQLSVSIGVQFGAAKLSAKVGPRDRLVYGRIQELGGPNNRGAVLPERPYLRPAFDAMHPRILQYMAKAIKEAEKAI